MSQTYDLGGSKIMAREETHRRLKAFASEHNVKMVDLVDAILRDALDGDSATETVRKVKAAMRRARIAQLEAELAELRVDELLEEERDD